jgi:hypothetical protein
MEEQPDRRQALVDLVDLRKPIDQAIRSLSIYQWGTAPEVVLGARQIILMLERFVARDVDAHDLERWANAIEGRDDVEYDPRCHSDVANFLFEASTQEVNGTFTADRASEWIRRFT